MHTLILVSHIVLMISSMALMAGALGLGFLGKRSAAFTATIGEATTVLGGLTGIVLLLGSPLSIECAILTAYLVAMTSLYIFGFAMGDADNARLIRARR